jgi:hypothetical protein
LKPLAKKGEYLFGCTAARGHKIPPFAPSPNDGEGRFETEGPCYRCERSNALRTIMLALALAAALLIAGCEKLMQDMYDQPKYEPLEASPLFGDGLSSRSPLPGTVAQSSGALADASSGRVGATLSEGQRQAGRG